MLGFDIPLIRSSWARELILVLFPCPHCGYSQFKGERIDGACRHCGVPFWIEPHHAHGYSKRCYRRVQGYR